MSNTLLLTKNGGSTDASLSNNEDNTPFVDKAHEISVYEKILAIHSQVFSGTHPRLKVPQHALRKSTAKPTVPSLIGPSAAPAASLPADTSKNDEAKDDTIASESTSTATIDKNVSLATGSSDPAQITVPPQVAPQVATTATAPQVSKNKPSAANIDPIFLTESPVVTRAKVQLQRDKLEKSILSQTYRDRTEHKQRLSASEQNPPFDVDEVYAQALSIVQHVPPSNDQEAGTESSDAVEEEGLYYSSQGPSSPHPLIADDDHYSPVSPEFTTLGGTDDSTFTEKPPFSRTTHASQGVQENVSCYSPREIPGSFDEPEYSPPEPTAPLVSSEAFEPGYSTAPLQGYDISKNPSPLPDAPIFEDFIASPVGPVPMQMPPVTQNIQSYGMNIAQPSRSNLLSNGRKRRRGQQQQHQPLPHISASTPRVGHKFSSPSVQVKTEAVSPPPFVAPPVRNLSILSKPPNRPLSRYESSQHLPLHDGFGYNQPHAVDRDHAAYSPVYGFGRPVRAGTYNQRFAAAQPSRSFHRSHRVAPSPIPARSRLAPGKSRAPSVVDARYADTLEHDGGRRYDTDYMLPPSPALQREATAYAEPVEGQMSKRRVIVDEQGNRYIEAAPTPRRPPLMTPKIYNPHIPAEGYAMDEEDGLLDPVQHQRRDHYADMPPPVPAPVYRRIVDYDPRDGSVVSERKVFLREPDYGTQYADYQSSMRAPSRAPRALRSSYSRHQPQPSDEFDDIPIPPPSRRHMAVEPHGSLRNAPYGDHTSYSRAASIMPGYEHDAVGGDTEGVYGNEPSQFRYREPYSVGVQGSRGGPRYDGSRMRMRNERVQRAYPEHDAVPFHQRNMFLDDEYEDDADHGIPMDMEEYGPISQNRSLRRY